MAEFANTFATFHHCVVCGSEISLSYAARASESWKACAQPLQHASPSVPRVAQPLVAPGLCPPTFAAEQEAGLVHASCWHVVARLWGKTEFTAAELDGFLDCARDASPFLPEIRFREAPDRLDVTIDHSLEAQDLEHRTSRAETDAQRRFEALCAGLKDEGIKSPVLLGLGRHALPERLDAFVSHALQDPGEAGSGTGGPARRFWAKVVGLLTSTSTGPDSPFSRPDSPSRAARVAQALRNIQRGGPSRFPHAANNDVVRANASTILLSLQLIPVEDICEAEPLGLAANGKPSRLQRPRAVPLSALRPGSPFRLSFLTVRREYFVDNMKFGRRFRVGMKYLRTIDFAFHDDDDMDQALPDLHVAAPATHLVPAVRTLCGMQLVRDGIGVFAVHAKDGDDWYTVWQQDPTATITPDMVALPTSAQWPGKMQDGELLLVSDTLKDIAVFDQFSQYLQSSDFVSLVTLNLEGGSNAPRDEPPPINMNPKKKWWERLGIARTLTLVLGSATLPLVLLFLGFLWRESMMVVTGDDMESGTIWGQILALGKSGAIVTISTAIIRAIMTLQANLDRFANFSCEISVPEENGDDGDTTICYVSSINNSTTLRENSNGPWVMLSDASGIEGLRVTACITNLDSPTRIVNIRSRVQRLDITEPGMLWGYEAQQCDTALARLQLGVSSSLDSPWSREDLGVSVLVSHWRSSTESGPGRSFISDYLLRGMTPRCEGIHCNLTLSDSANQGLVLSKRERAAMNDGVHESHVYLFKDTLDDTENPALAMQALLTRVSQMAYYDQLAKSRTNTTASAVFSETTQMAADWTGYKVAAALVSAHLVVVAIVTTLFLRNTSSSCLGNSWQAVSQIASSETLPILEQADTMKDWEIRRNAKRQGLNLAQLGVIRQRGGRTYLSV
ncbi:ATP-dependent RNA helicase dbp3 [Purpureocillium lavendulum]|uniref:ATP-dependent RNA helicase dbp3 n=1 Tax=Purpureocillium lavendulum TaxID=1247861 RepID=A0AB34FVQ4_9HYPO|nr:ATP-dependent RNA helicase dbp3 [Purpureocillium lavendulum]